MLYVKDKLKNAFMNSDAENIKIEYRKVLREFIKDNIELFLQFTNDDLFNKWLSKTVFDELSKKYKED
jgi:type I restriction-modification system, R subunit